MKLTEPTFPMWNSAVRFQYVYSCGVLYRKWQLISAVHASRKVDRVASKYNHQTMKSSPVNVNKSELFAPSWGGQRDN